MAEDFKIALQGKTETSNNQNGELDDSFFPVVKSASIDQTLWSQVKPFQLAVLKALPGGKEYEFVEVYTIPVGPESYSVSTPFAITTQATLGGIVEQHNGAPFRTISISGTTGVLPDRKTKEYAAVGGSLGSIFSGTVANATNTFNAARAAIDPGSSYVSADKETDLTNKTGYYQFLVLRAFLESYVTKKKTQPDLRLAFVVWKEQVIYLVSPVSFDMQRQAASALEYRYSLQFRAWKRIPTGTVMAPSVTRKFSSLQRQNLFKDVVGRIDAARRAILSAKKTIESVQSDFEGNIGNSIREVALGLKDVVGLAKTAWDFPRKFSEYIDREIADNYANIDFSQIFDPNLRRQIDQMSRAAQEHADRAGQDSAPTTDRVAASNKAAGRSQDTTPTSPHKRIGAILSNPDNEALLEPVVMDKLSLSPTAQAYRQALEAQASNKTKKDYLTLHHNLALFIADYSDKVGLGSPAYNALLGRATSAQVRAATLDDVAALSALQTVLFQYSRLASVETEDQDILNSLEYVANLAGLSDIAFRVPKSKFAVPFPYGGTLEKLAYTYLGDPDRWYEIATLNGLHEPYVDEVGFQLPIQYSGAGNTVQVTDASDLYIGQPVSLSLGPTRLERVIKDIVPLGAAFGIVLSGDDDLSQFGAGMGGVLSGFKHGTVNSGQLIYIPSDEPLDPDLLSKSVPGAQDVDVFTRVAGWDLLLTSKNDLALTPDGDAKLATGMGHIIQRIRVVFATPLGSLLHHPNYGFAVQPGQSNADMDARQVLNSANGSLAEDPNLTVTHASVEALGPVTRLNVEVAVRGTPTRLPVTVDVRA